MEIQVGEYVRTELGQITIVDKVLKEFIDEHRSISKRDIVEFLGKIKHSKNIIDLIEIKDLIKFRNKLPNSLKDEEMIIHIFDNDTLEEIKQAVEREEIEILSIVTHQCFKQIEYEV